MAETAVVAPVEPAAPVAPAEPVAPAVVMPSDPKERHEFRLKGPQGPPKETPTEPAAPAVEAKGKPKQDKLTAEQRESQLDRDIEERQARIREKVNIKRELERQLAERTTPEPKPPVETKKSAWDRLKTLPDAPKLDQFENYEDFSAAQAEFITEHRYQELRAAEQRQEQITKRQQAEYTRLKTFETRYAETDAESKAIIDASDLQVPNDPRHPVTFAITDSPIPGALMRYLVEHPDEHTSILSLPDPNAQYVAMQRIEARLQALREASPSTTPSRNADSRPAPSRVADSRPASPAPQEPVTLGRKPGSPVDELKLAWERGDTRTARRLQLERDRGSLTR